MNRTQKHLTAAAVAAICAIGMCLAAEAQPPLGHPDFYPSSDRPIGWRGDRSGAWPGAGCVTSWNAESGENIVWKSPMPGAGFSQPLVIGEKVITTADPNLLVCLNVHTGKILWQTAIDHTAAMEPAMAKKARAEMAFADEKWLQYSRWKQGFQNLLDMLGPGAKPAMIFDKRMNILPPAEGISAEARTLWSRLIEEQKAEGWNVNPGKKSTGAIRGGSPTNKRLQEAHMLYDVWWHGERYDGLITWSFATPTTDGEFIYVTTVNNAVAAVDLNGKIEWLIWETRGNDKQTFARGIAAKKGGIGTRHTASPVLYGDYLAVTQNHDTRVYDKRTGKKLWSMINPVAATGIKPSAGVTRAWPEGTSPCVVKAPLPDGTVLPLLADGSFFLWRLADGKLLTKDLYYGACSSPATTGNLLMKNNESTYLIRVTAKDSDTLAVERLYDNPHGNPDAKSFPDTKASATSICHGDWWYADVTTGVRISLRDGSWDQNGPTIRMGGNTSPILAGTRVYRFNGFRLYPKGGSLFSQTIDGVGGCGHAALEGGKTTILRQALIDRRPVEDKEFGLRTLHADMSYEMHTSSPAAQANRLFVRTKGYLWCIGNPKEAFPVSNSWPSQGRVK